MFDVFLKGTHDFLKSVRLVFFLFAVLPFPSFAQDAGKFSPGVAVTFTSVESKSSDVTVLPNVWLFVASGQPPTPFLPGGKFTAVWNGFLHLDLRGEISFRAEVNGDVKLELNGQSVLEAVGNGNLSEPSKLIRLNKGTNAMVVTYRSPASGDARLRLSWTPKDSLTAPIPLSGLFHLPTNAESQGQRLRRGRELFVEHRCAKCHTAPASDSGIPELAMDAPSFDGIGTRRNFEWLAQWIADPKALRATAAMPRLWHGVKAKEDSEAAAAFLASLKDATPPAAPGDGNADPEAGQKLFESLHCVACHNAPNASERDANKISFKHVTQKFATGALASFLQRPDAHYAWIRMPNFEMSRDEGGQIAAFLIAHADKASGASSAADTAILERGKKNIQTAGCLNCHSAKLENQFKTKPLAELAASAWTQGCLAERVADDAKAPFFAFTAEDRAALQCFAATDRASLSRHVPAEFAERQTRSLNCAGCHGQVEGFPPLEILGGKLRPEWVKSFIAGEIPDRSRPWLEARMPAFTQRAEWLAHGLAAQHGYPPRTPEEPPIDQEAAKVGQKLISTDAGFACIACHAAASVTATLVFESAGINFAYGDARLLRPYFERWMRSPLSIDPGTKMPSYFDEQGKSPLAEVYEGDGAKQINAIWQYIRLGEKMPPPPGTTPSQ